MLPIMTTMEDLDVLVAFLKTKINGSTIKEAESVVGRQYIDGRKLSGLQTWGFISKEIDHIGLTQLGREFSRGSEDEKARMLMGVIREIPPYNGVLEWASFQNFESITTVDVGSRWIQFNKDYLGTDNENTINSNVVCFFHLAQGAGLGKLVIGRRGQPTRLELAQSVVSAFLSHGSGASIEEKETAAISQDELSGFPEPGFWEADSNTPTEPSGLTRGNQNGVEKVFVGHSSNGKILQQIRTILNFGKFEVVIAEDEETTAVPVPDKVMDAMHKCHAAIMNISADTPINGDGNEYAINNNVLIEVGAAFVLYNKNVILLVDDRVELPSNLAGLYECRYHGDSLDFESTMKLQQALINFRN
ncbi:MAG: nucleotide-binding protein [Chloroflexi bacterium]|nr:nucleotide-binding protein [Chloroflexota bacterium]MDA1270396.1 nucleotide-binding protein [Chloroflexota bacterium]PKB58771.1 MAG: hypothetical protein BZY83_05330 [SAR202 cluster bacterium Casp-Chloro-G2]